MTESCGNPPDSPKPMEVISEEQPAAVEGGCSEKTAESRPICPWAATQPLKVSFYEALMRQLAEDNLRDVALALRRALNVFPNPQLPSDFLFSLYKASAFQTSLDAALTACKVVGLSSAATAATLQMTKGDDSKFKVFSDSLTQNGMDSPRMSKTQNTHSNLGKSVADTSPDSIAAIAAAAARGAAAAMPADADANLIRAAATAAAAASAAALGAPASDDGADIWRPLKLTPVPGLTFEERSLIFSAKRDDSARARSWSSKLEANIRCSASFKRPCLCVSTANDMSFAAGGGEDGSVRVMRLKEAPAVQTGQDSLNRRVLVNTSVLDPHKAPVSALCFHPQGQICFSGSLDSSVKVFQLSRQKKASSKPLATISDLAPVGTVACHPCGDFLYVGTMDPIIRIYDLQTLRCYTSLEKSSHQRGAICDIKVSSNGSIFAAASKDGSIMFFDGVTATAVNRLKSAHQGYGVTSLSWSRSERYIISNGFDGQTRIWDVRKGQQVLTFRTGERGITAGSAVFMKDECFIASINGSTDGSLLSIYDAYTGCLKTDFVDPHPQKQKGCGVVRALHATSHEFSLVTGSIDGCCRVIDFGAFSSGQDDEQKGNLFVDRN